MKRRRRQKRNNGVYIPPLMIIIPLSVLILITLIIVLLLNRAAKKSGREIIDLSFKEVLELNFGTGSTNQEEEISNDNNLPGASVTYNALLKKVNSSESTQSYLSYMAYIPDNVNETTPIFIFMHGSSDIGESFQEYIDKYTFAKQLEFGLWKPDFIFLMPILPAQGSWNNTAGYISSMINEIVAGYGGDISNMYISGASAGSNGSTPVAQSIIFNGAIYMAGYLGGRGNALTVSEFLALWSGKQVWYYRDNLFDGGGYGYVADYVADCKEKAPDYNVYFTQIDLNWNHDVGLVDATFLPESYNDLNGQPCHDAINKLIYGE